jgi:hypothetical protein
LVYERSLARNWARALPWNASDATVRKNVGYSVESERSGEDAE